MQVRRNSALRKIGGAAISVLFVATIVLFCAVTFAPRLFGVELRNVVSGSMEPAVEKGSLVIATPADFDDLSPGDVILFRTPDDDRRMVTHRVVRVAETDGARAIQTRGDANDRADPWQLHGNDVLGKVQLDIPKLGFAVERIRSREGFLLLMVLPGTVIVLGELPLWYRLLRGRKRRNEYRGAGAAELPPLPRTERLPSPFLSSAGVLAIAVMVAAASSYMLAPRGDNDAAEGRVAAEAVSISQHSARLADGDAFSGDIDILRYAEDGRLKDAETPAEEQLTALRQMLLVNTNRFDALAIVGLDGRVLQTTDPVLADAAASAAYAGASAQQGVAAAFASWPHPAADYAAPIRGVDGAMRAILIGRTTLERLWAPSLRASIDGSANAIVDADGTTIAGAAPIDPGVTLVTGGSGAIIPMRGADMYCASRPIGRDTHLDAGMSIVSCMPATLAAAEPVSFRQYAIDSIAMAAIVITLGVLALMVLLHERRREEERYDVGVRAIEARLLSQREPPQ